MDKVREDHEIREITQSEFVDAMLGQVASFIADQSQLELILLLDGSE